MRTVSNANPWLAFVKPRMHRVARLFCFPYAGGGAQIFKEWADHLPASVEVFPVQLPGLGKGLFIPLDQFEVSLEPEQPATLLFHEQHLERAKEVGRWTLHDLTLSAEYLVALAVEGSDWHLTCFDWAGNLSPPNRESTGCINSTIRPDRSLVG